MMRAIQINRPTDVIPAKTIDIGQPVPERGEILIKTGAYAFIPGTDDYAGIAGTVESVGGGGTGFERGSKIFGIIKGGVCAQYTVVRADQIARMPANLIFGQAAALAGPLVVAHQILSETARLRWGQRLLIRNAVGGIARVMVQVAKTVGAHVTIMVTRNNKALFSSLNVDKLFDMREGVIMESPSDIVVNFTPAGALEEVKLPRQQVDCESLAIINWEQSCAQRLQFGKMLVEDGSVKPHIAQQLSWNNGPGLQTILGKRAPEETLVLNVD